MKAELGSSHKTTESLTVVGRVNSLIKRTICLSLMAYIFLFRSSHHSKEIQEENGEVGEQIEEIKLFCEQGLLLILCLIEGMIDMNIVEQYLCNTYLNGLCWGLALSHHNTESIYTCSI